MFTFFRQQLHWGTSLTRAPAGNASWDVRWSRRSVSSSTASPQMEISCSTSPGYSGQKQSIWHSMFRYQCYDHSFSSTGTVRKIRSQWIFKNNPIELKPTISEFIVLALFLSTVLYKKKQKKPWKAYLFMSAPYRTDFETCCYYFYSKVTLHTDCCTALADHPTSYRSFVSILQKHQHKSVSILYTNLWYIVEVSSSSRVLVLKCY